MLQCHPSDLSPTVLLYHRVEQFPTSRKADILRDTTTLQLTRLRPSIGTAPSTKRGTLVPRPIHAGALPLRPTWDIGFEADQRRNFFPHHHHLTTLDTYHHPTSSRLYFGNGTPETGNPFISSSSKRLPSLAAALLPFKPTRFKRAILFWSRRFPPNPPTTDLILAPFQRIGFFHRAPLSRLFPTRPISTEHLCPGPLHSRRGAPADFLLAPLHHDVYQRAAVLRSPPIPPNPTCTLRTRRDPPKPLCSGPVFPAEVTA